MHLGVRVALGPIWVTDVTSMVDWTDTGKTKTEERELGTMGTRSGEELLVNRDDYVRDWESGSLDRNLETGTT